MIRILETYVVRYRPKEAEEGEEPEEIELPRDIFDRLINSVVFAAIWGIGGVLDEGSRPVFEEFLMQVLNGDDVIEANKLDLGTNADGTPKAHEPMRIPNKIAGDYKSVFDLYFDQDELSWRDWMQTRDRYVVDKSKSFLQLSIPTVDTVRVQHICGEALRNLQHVLLVGPTGTGKSLALGELLGAHFNDAEWTSYQLGFSAQTTALQTELIMQGKMEKKKRGYFGPKMNKKGVIFVDDLNMPQKNKYGAQPPIELLRQYMDYGGWYNVEDPEREFYNLINCIFAAAMSRATVSTRYIRHFNILYCEPYSAESKSAIFSTVMDWMFAKSNPSYPQPVQQMKEGIVNHTLTVFERTSESFRPTPAKGHYSYNLRDIAKVFQGISKSSAKAVKKEGDMVKLWAHECARVFQDRLVSAADRDTFQGILTKTMKEKFRMDWNTLVKQEPLLFASFVPLCYPDGDTTKRPYPDVYCELVDLEKSKTVCEQKLVDYNSDAMNYSRKMDLVLFFAAIEHVVKIHRIITTEFGHALLIGVGGSGRKSLTNLATYIAEYDTFGIEITKSYNFDSWRDDMRERLYMDAGTRNDYVAVFLFNDTQIINESFLEDVNNVLNNGEIPNLYPAIEDIANVCEIMLDENKNDPRFKGMGQEELMSEFKQNCKQSVHVVLTMSPIGEAFRRRLRMFPALVNCCAIDYFLPWPQDALQSVAEYFIKEVDDLPEMNGVCSICVDMQLRTTMLAEKYKNVEKRYYYVTPTSYLVLLRNFKKLLGRKRGQIDSVIHKYEVGIKQLAEANEAVAKLQEQLKILMPKLV
jgi:dynein heavy chain